MLALLVRSDSFDEWVVNIQMDSGQAGTSLLTCSQFFPRVVTSYINSCIHRDVNREFGFHSFYVFRIPTLRFPAAHMAPAFRKVTSELMLFEYR